MSWSLPRTLPPLADLRADVTAGLLVFLVALPLSLGIAVASGFPPVAGVLTAVVGGLLASPLGSAPLTIKGPAAGLIVVVLGAVNELGQGDAALGYRRTLAVGAVAAVIQVVLAQVRAGRLAVLMPPSVVHGMLAAIGVIIVAKQTPVVLGVLGAKGEPLSMLAHVPDYVQHLNPVIFAVGAVALAVLIGWPHLPVPGLRRLPAPLVVVLLAVPLSLWLHLNIEHDYDFLSWHEHVGPAWLVAVPARLLDAVTLPDFGVVFSPVSLKYVVMFALVGTVESLLSVVAIDALDPRRRASNLDRDLRATGLANLASAFVGGMPMISEIVRSRANLDAGARSARANFVHGLCLLVFVVLLPDLLRLVPLAALAAMLVMVGLRLASPRAFQHSLHLGKDQFALFFVTFAVTLATDLLVGVAAGLVLKLGLHCARGARLRDLLVASLAVRRIETPAGARVEISARGPLVFTNLLAVQRTLAVGGEPGVHTVVLDLSGVQMIDHTTLERINGLAREWPTATLEWAGLERLVGASGHALAFRRARPVAP